jgi:hypothetical protein
MTESERSAKRLANLTGGTRKGKPNKIARDVKEMVLRALNEVGGVAYLVRKAEENPVAFLTLVGKVLPLTVSNDPNNPMPAATVQFIITPVRSAVSED